MEDGYSHRSVLVFAASPLVTFVCVAVSSFVSVMAQFSMYVAFTLLSAANAPRLGLAVTCVA